MCAITLIQNQSTSARQDKTKDMEREIRIGDYILWQGVPGKIVGDAFYTMPGGPNKRQFIIELHDRECCPTCGRGGSGAFRFRVNVDSSDFRDNTQLVGFNSINR